MKRYTTVLTIAGSDGSGGAGIQADIKTITAIGCYGLSVITAVTAQNTRGVNAVYPVSEQCVIDQFQALVNDISIDAIKIGMLGNVKIIKTIAKLLRNLKSKPPIILDTILKSSSGTVLLSSEAINSLKGELFPMATLITPNIPEALLLSGIKTPLNTREAVEKCAMELIKTGCRAVFLKGGHGENNECCDCLVHDNLVRWFSSARILTQNTHGTGCTLSSAIAAYMAKGESIEEAIGDAKVFLNEAMHAGADYHLGDGDGDGYGPLHHCYRLWK